MAHINLLPWRAERRKLRQREFFMQLGAAFVAALLFIILWAYWMGLRIDNQNDRNAYLQGEIKQLDERIAKIKDLEQVRSRLLARKQIIEQLQASRSQMVHLFDELVRTIPTSARLTGLKQAGETLSLDGVAQSNASVAQYMRNIEVSPWMGHVELLKTENNHDSSRMPYVFGLTVALKTKSDAASSSTAPTPAVAASVSAKAQSGVASNPAALPAASNAKDEVTVTSKPTSAASVAKTPAPHPGAGGQP